MRRALVGAVLGGALALGGTAVTAQAAEPAPAPTASADEMNQIQASWHFYKAYWTRNQCENVGRSSGRSYQCRGGIGNDGEFKYFLYLWY